MYKSLTLPLRWHRRRLLSLPQCLGHTFARHQTACPALLGTYSMWSSLFDYLSSPRSRRMGRRLRYPKVWSLSQDCHPSRTRRSLQANFRPVSFPRHKCLLWSLMYCGCRLIHSPKSSGSRLNQVVLRCLCRTTISLRSRHTGQHSLIHCALVSWKSPWPNLPISRTRSPHQTKCIWICFQLVLSSSACRSTQ